MLKRIFTYSIFFILILFISGAKNINSKMTAYNFSKPDLSLVLPDILHEVSGITYINPTTIACVQDELGIIFLYDFTEGKIKRQLTFSEDGDYEGITKVGNRLYVLRSDGNLYEISDYESNIFKVKFYSTGISAKDNEGLCYDEQRNRLLIASKSNISKESEFKDKRVIYGFDLNSKKLYKSPAFYFDINVIYDFMIKNKIDIPTKTKKKSGNTEPNLKFRTSAIAINPISKKLFLLSATDHLLFIFNVDGKVEHIEQLNPKLFNKAEGITFLENGDLIISNEGENNKPTLLLFNYKKL
ncbi:MAG: SdiA-regulated domain-containing protein [Ignavibacteria bacterium]|nr:SdiA-regulated domain-containing protein [Ignavibacteria bacterium]